MAAPGHLAAVTRCPGSRGRTRARRMPRPAQAGTAGRRGSCGSGAWCARQAASRGERRGLAGAPLAWVQTVAHTLVLLFPEWPTFHSLGASFHQCFSFQPTGEYCDCARVGERGRLPRDRRAELLATSAAKAGWSEVQAAPPLSAPPLVSPTPNTTRHMFSAFTQRMWKKESRPSKQICKGIDQEFKRGADGQSVASDALPCNKG